MHTDQMQTDEIMYRKQPSRHSHIISSNWHILKGKTRQRWAELTQRNIDKVIAGWEEEHSGRIQKLYHLSKKEADQMNERW
ncbi:MAG: general stress protein CsbD [Nitrococcus sp.]|nr:general stress protein CsbD [Nitrococcus sp.]